MASNLINQALRRRSNAQHRHAARLNLCAASILNHLSRDAHATRLAAQLEHLLLALGLHGNLGLTVLFPARQHLSVGRVGVLVARELLVAGEGGVRALRGNLAYISRGIVSESETPFHARDFALGGFVLTLCHAQVSSDDEDELALLIADIDLRSRHRSTQPLSAVRGLAVGPVGRVVEDAVALVNVALVALDGVGHVAAALLGQGRRYDVAARREDAKHVARHDAGKRRGEDDARRDAVV